MPEPEKILRRNIPIWTLVYYRSRGILSTFEIITTYMIRPVKISERMLITARKSLLECDLLSCYTHAPSQRGSAHQNQRSIRPGAAQKL